MYMFNEIQQDNMIRGVYKASASNLCVYGSTWPIVPHLDLLMGYRQRRRKIQVASILKFKQPCAQGHSHDAQTSQSRAADIQIQHSPKNELMPSVPMQVPAL